MTPDRPAFHTYHTIRNLDAADTLFGLEYRHTIDNEKFALYATNWIEELTAGQTAILNTRKIVFYDGEPSKKGYPLDAWGQQIRTVRSTNADGSLALNFYSIGADGVSRSAGNDPDDINSWNTRVGPGNTQLNASPIKTSDRD